MRWKLFGRGTRVEGACVVLSDGGLKLRTVGTATGNSHPRPRASAHLGFAGPLPPLGPGFVQLEGEVHTRVVEDHADHEQEDLGGWRRWQASIFVLGLLKGWTNEGT